MRLEVDLARTTLESTMNSTDARAAILPHAKVTANPCRFVEDPIVATVLLMLHTRCSQRCLVARKERCVMNP